MHSPPHNEVPFPPVRELLIDFLRAGQAKRLAHGFLEVDISRSLARIKECREVVPVSLTAYFVYCLAHAVHEHKELHAYRKGRRKLVIFDDVDVNTLLEKQQPDGSVLPMVYIVRGANHKTFAQINHEVLTASKGTLRDDTGVQQRRRLLKFPGPIRRLIGWWIRRDPVKVKQYWGTVLLTNPGAFVYARPSWGAAMALQTCSVGIGGIFERVYWNDGQPEPRATLGLTVTVDHDIVDGAPGVRFGNKFIELLEGAHGLGEDFFTETRALRGEKHETETV